MMSEYHHLPVMVSEVVQYLVINPEGVYLDLTVGLGGHLRAISEATKENARLYGLDRDPEATVLAGENLKEYSQVKKLVCISYSRIDSVVSEFEDKLFDGILLDLGISSRQMDDPKRGFSFRFDSPLDMRFNPESVERTAADLINSLSEKKLTEIIRDFGEQRNASRLAGVIVRERQKKMILTTAQLAEIIRKEVKPPYQNKSLARVFQAFRIAVNQELKHLSEVLPIAFSLLKAGGRLAVLSYHSLEDRIVKRFFQQQAKGCICPDELPVCICGIKPTLKIITKKALIPQSEELRQNSRARSAKLRVAEKI